MVSAHAVQQAIDIMSVLKFFPAQPAGVGLILSQMCSTDDQVRWLANRVVNLYNEWPGPRELRAVLCSKFKPADGVEAYSADARFAEEGIPSERTSLPAPDYKMLPAGSVDPQMHALVKGLASKRRLQ